MGEPAAITVAYYIVGGLCVSNTYTERARGAQKHQEKPTVGSRRTAMAPARIGHLIIQF